MRRIVMAVLPLVSLLAAGCDFFNGGDSKEKFYTYCDATGCYTCNENGCSRNPGVPTGGSCTSNADCSEGCYCDPKTGKCIEGGYCNQPGDCSSQLVCDVQRHSCEPSTGVDGGTKMSCATSK